MSRTFAITDDEDVVSVVAGEEEYVMARRVPFVSDGAWEDFAAALKAAAMLQEMADTLLGGDDE